VHQEDTINSLDRTANNPLIPNLDRLAVESGTTIADVIVRAFRLYEKTLEEASKGHVIRFIPEAEVRNPNASFSASSVLR
jgi:hypothetical protein